MYPRIIFLWNGLISLTISLMNDHILLLYRNIFVLIDILSFLNMWMSHSAALMQKIFMSDMSFWVLCTIQMFYQSFFLCSSVFDLFSIRSLFLSIVGRVFFSYCIRFGLAPRTVMSSAVSRKMSPTKKFSGSLSPRKLPPPPPTPPTPHLTTTTTTTTFTPKNHHQVNYPKAICPLENCRPPPDNSCVMQKIACKDNISSE